MAVSTRRFAVLAAVSAAVFAIAFGAASASAIPGITATSTGTVITALPAWSTGAEMYGTAATSSTVYSVDATNKQIDVFSLTGAIDPAILLPAAATPTALALSPDGSTAYVTDTGNGNIYKVNLATATVTTFSTTLAGYAIVVSPDGSTMYVLNNSDYQVYSFDTATVTAITHSVTNGIYEVPYEMAFSPDGSSLYVSYGAPLPPHATGGVRFLDSSTLAETNAVDLQNAEGLAVEKNGDIAVGTNDGVSTGTIVELTPAGALTPRSVAVGIEPKNFLISPDGSTIYDGDRGSGDLYAISTSAFTATAALGSAGSAEGLAVSPDGHNLYVAGGASQEIYPYSVASLTLEVPASTPTGTSAAPLVATVADGSTSVADYSAGNILFEVLNSSTAVVASGTASPDATTGTVTLPVNLSSLPAGTYSVRATLTFDPGTGPGKVLVLASGMKITSGLPVTGAPDETVPAILASAALVAGIALTLLGRRGERASARHRTS